MHANQRLASHCSDALVVYPHQLFSRHPALVPDRHVFMVEEPLILTWNPTHRQKLLLHRLSMDVYAQQLAFQGHQVAWIRLESLLKEPGSMWQQFRQLGIQNVHIADTHDDFLEQWISSCAHSFGIQRVWYESPMFLCSKQHSMDRYKHSKKHLASFYKQMRVDYRVLVKPKATIIKSRSKNKSEPNEHTETTKNHLDDQTAHDQEYSTSKQTSFASASLHSTSFTLLHQSLNYHMPCVQYLDDTRDWEPQGGLWSFDAENRKKLPNEKLEQPGWLPNDLKDLHKLYYPSKHPIIREYRRNNGKRSWMDSLGTTTALETSAGASIEYENKEKYSNNEHLLEDPDSFNKNPKKSKKKDTNAMDDHVHASTIPTSQDTSSIKDEVIQAQDLPSSSSSWFPLSEEEILQSIDWVKSIGNLSSDWYPPIETYGSLLWDDLWLPYTHQQAEQCLQSFLEERFVHFGLYEDAMTTVHDRLFHATLSPLMNIGLLTPDQVLSDALRFAKNPKHRISIASLEGFVRQVLGWREFVRGSYCVDGRMMRSKYFMSKSSTSSPNAQHENDHATSKFDRSRFELLQMSLSPTSGTSEAVKSMRDALLEKKLPTHGRDLPAGFWDASTGIFPLDICIKKAIRYGYNHHIERLMVLGNFLLLTQTDPDLVYRWFMAMYVDAYDWVMVPNVYSMSQYADGGLFTTKPYVSGANYLKKMSDFPSQNQISPKANSRKQKKEVTMEQAKPSTDWEVIWTSLYWNFIDTHQHWLVKNHRLSMMPNMLKKMDPEKKQFYLQQAKAFLEQHQNQHENKKHL